MRLRYSTEYTPAEAPRPRRRMPRPRILRVCAGAIDGGDARFRRRGLGQPTTTRNPGGWHIVVTVADVGARRRAARSTRRRRGSSVYFGPRRTDAAGALSNDLCSWCRAPTGRTRPPNGRSPRRKRATARFERVVMRSAARRRAGRRPRDGRGRAVPAAQTGCGLYGAFASLDRARRARGAGPRPRRARVVLDGEGRRSQSPADPARRHRLIEIMISPTSPRPRLESRIAAARACDQRIRKADHCAISSPGGHSGLPWPRAR